MDAKRVFGGALVSAVCLAAVMGCGAAVCRTDEPEARPAFSEGPEAAEGVLWIDSFEALAALSETVAETKGGYTGEVRLTCDIEAEGEWIPIGSPEHMFLGTFDGQGYAISGLKASGGEFQGLFGYVGRGGCVRNVTIRGAEISGARYTGGVAGYSAGVIENCRVLGGRISGTGRGVFSSAAGGIVGLSSGAVENCLVRATRVAGGRNTGGVVGNQCAGTTVRCIVSGEVLSREKGQALAGGIVGSLQTDGGVAGCISRADVRAPGGSWAGGVVGGVMSGKVKCCVSMGRIWGREAGGVTGYVGRSASVIACRYAFGAAPGVGEGRGAGVSRVLPGSDEDRMRVLRDSFHAGRAADVPSLRLNTSLV